MNKKSKDLNDLIANATHYLKSQLSYAQSTVDKYRRGWKQLKKFMDSNGIKCYSQEVERQILYHEFRDRDKRELSDDEQYFYNALKKLTEFMKTGRIEVRNRPCKKPPVFTGPMGEIIRTFMDYKRIEERLSLARLRCYRRELFRFLTYCNETNIRTIKEINLAVILLYISKLDGGIEAPSIISILRSFLRYAFQHKHLAADYSNKIPKYKSINQPKLPSVYSKDEIEKLISSVERSSSIGKRNYAIILIAARLGLRASDISWLQFDGLHWDTCTLQIKQVKTGKELVLPLLPDVGNAIIDYLKYGRPESLEPYVFLKEKPPYGYFTTSSVVSHIVQRAFRNAGIDIRDRKFGSHSLRHTLGFRMLEESTILPVISEVLGHESTESARYYLRIDLKSMRQCVIDVPPVTIEFYEQKGGAFYE
jgi:site-specific recombinase XerD